MNEGLSVLGRVGAIGLDGTEVATTSRGTTSTAALVYATATIKDCPRKAYRPRRRTSGPFNKPNTPIDTGDVTR